MRSSVKPFKPANDNLIDDTLEIWRPRADRDLKREDAREIVKNVSGFFSILAEWAYAEMTPPANDNDRTANGANDEARHEG